MDDLTKLTECLDRLASISSDLGLLKCGLADADKDRASDATESAQDYVDAAIRDLRDAIRAASA